MKKIERMPYTSPWGEVQTCVRLNDAAFEVTTARHGGVMIGLEQAGQMLSMDAAAIGFLDGAFLCFEEDRDASVALKELYEKGLIDEDVYFSLYRVGYAGLFDDYSHEELIEVWKKGIDNNVKAMHPDYYYRNNPGTSFQVSENGKNTVCIDVYTGTDKNVIVPDMIDGRRVTEIGNAFMGREKLLSVMLPDTVELVWPCAFHGCESLELVEASCNTMIPSGAFSLDKLDDASKRNRILKLY